MPHTVKIIPVYDRPFFPSSQPVTRLFFSIPLYDVVHGRHHHLTQDFAALFVAKLGKVPCPRVLVDQGERGEFHPFESRLFHIP